MTNDGVRVVRLPRPHHGQSAVIADPSRFRVACCGRRWGKTQLGVYSMIAAVQDCRELAWFAPTYKMAQDVWRDLTERLRPITTSCLQDEKRLSLLGGATIDVWSMEASDSVRGRKYALAVIDEAAMVSDLGEVWNAAIRPTLADYQGRALFLSTPRGYNAFHDLFVLGLDPSQPEWSATTHPTTSNPYIPAGEIDAARASMDAIYFRQEFEASFEATVGRVVHTFDRALNVRADVRDLGDVVLVGMDFNVDPMSAVLASRAGDELHVWGEIELNNSGTAEMAAEIGRRFAGRRVVVCPDPSGVARKTAAPVGQTDFTLLRQAGFTIKAPSRAPAVTDRLNELRALCCNVEGRRRLFVHPSCRRLIQCLDLLAYKPGTNIVDKSQGHDHLVDGLSYLVSVEFPISRGAFGESAILGI